MKPKLIFTITMIIGIMVLGCKQQKQKVEVEEVRIDLINDEFPEAKQEIMETFGAIAQSLKDGDMDNFISCLWPKVYRV